MKKIRFYLSNKKEFLFDEDIADAILDSEDQLIRILNSDGQWTGETLNKAHIVNTDVDIDATREANSRIVSLQKPTLTEEQENELIEKRKLMLKKYRPEFLKEKDA